MGKPFKENLIVGSSTAYGELMNMEELVYSSYCNSVIMYIPPRYIRGWDSSVV
jgi:hypothetical protein